MTTIQYQTIVVDISRQWQALSEDNYELDLDTLGLLAVRRHPSLQPQDQGKEWLADWRRYPHILATIGRYATRAEAQRQILRYARNWLHAAAAALDEVDHGPH
jgi:hypothetical protein